MEISQKLEIKQWLMLAGSFLLWMIYALTYTHFSINSGLKYISGYLSFFGQVGFDFTAGFMCYKLYKNAESKSAQEIYLIFLFSFISAFISDAIYNYILNINDINKISNIEDSLFDIPFAFFLALQAIAWVKIILHQKNNASHKATLYIPSILIAAFIFCTFVFFMPWKISHFSIIGIYQSIDTVLEVIGFSAAIICLARTQGKPIALLAIGYLILISSDLMIRYKVVESLVESVSFFESTWALGLITMNLGFLDFIFNKKKINDFCQSEINTIHSQLSLWVFAISLMSVLVFCLSILLFSNGVSREESIYFLHQLPACFIIFSIISVTSSNFLFKILSFPFVKIHSIIERFLTDGKINEANLLSENDIVEFKSLEKFLIQAFLLQKQKNENDTKLAQISAQVAHDIRSPLAALNVLVKQTQSIPENQRVMIRNAAQQINNIANNLLEQYRVEKIDTNVLSSEIISLLLDSVVSEKRAQFIDSKIQIELNIDADSHGLFCDIIPADFKRVISNLINNAVEAIQKDGHVLIHLCLNENSVKIEIKDNGMGMPLALIEKIMNGESVSNKKSGHGIGLASAKQMIESWNGNLTISSQPGKGTSLNIILPKVKSADWISDQLNFIQNSSVIVLDDDQSIHDVWTSRIETEIPNAKLTLQHYYNPQELLNADANSDAVYLCDFELLGYQLTGLDVIEKLHLNNAVLVTSRYDEPEVRARCQKIGIKILPKSYAVHVPLNIEEIGEKSERSFLDPPKMTPHSSAMSAKPDLILIDDNKVLTDSWEMASLLSDKKIVVFNSIKEADKNIDQYSFDTTIYIDSDLGENIKGEDFAKTLYEKGYHNIYLATGHEPSHFDLKKLYWIKDVVGKTPRFDENVE